MVLYCDKPEMGEKAEKISLLKTKVKVNPEELHTF